MNSLDSNLYCLHCGTELQNRETQSRFCCAGCEYVYHLIHENGLDQFYDFQEGKSQPAPSTIFQNRDYKWIEEQVREGDKNLAIDQEAQFSVQGITCVGCIWLLEKVYLKEPGAISCELDSSAGLMTLKWKREKIDLVSFAKKIQSFGYLLGKRSRQVEKESRRLVSRMGLCGAFAMNSMLFAIPTYLGMEKSFEYAPLFARLLLFFSTLSVLVGGSYFLKRCWEGLRHQVFHIDIPIGLGIGIAYISSVVAWSQNRVDFLYLEFVSTFTFLMLVGRWAHLKAIEENRDRLLKEEESLRDLLEENSEEKIDQTSIQKDTRYRLSPGAAVPVQSVLLSSEGNFGMDWISGETDLRRWHQGEIVPSGALSLHSTPLLFQAKEPWSGSLLHALLDVQERRTHRNLILEKFVKNYLMIILAIAVIAGAAWYWKTGNGLVALQVVTSILVVSCPCASGVAIPMVDDRAALCLRRVGVYVREATLWHRLLRVKKIIFDKTGTVTMESLELDSPQCLRNLTLEQQERLFSLSRSSLHPVCTALRKELLALNTRLDQSPVIGVIEEVVGQGVEMRRGEGVDRLGRASWAIGKEGPGTVWSYQGEIVLEFEFKEKIRESARETIQQLIRKNYEIYLLSGDRSEKVRKMAHELGVSDARAFGEMTPQEKESWVRKNDLSDTLMLGDGANDSLAFNQSYCTGTPAINRSFLQKKSDFYWMGQSLKGIATLFEVAKMRERTIRRIITFAILYNSVVIGISVCGGMSPVLAAILMPSSSLITLLIAMSGMPLRLSKQK